MTATATPTRGNYDYRFFTEEQTDISAVIGTLSRHGYVALDKDNQPLLWAPSGFGMREMEGVADVMNVQNGATYNNARLDQGPILDQMNRSGYLAMSGSNLVWRWASTHNEARDFKAMTKVAEVATGKTIVYFL